MADAAEPQSLDDPIFLGRTVERLSNLIEEQSAGVFRQNGIEIPVKSCSLMTVLAALGSATAADLSRGLGVSHQLVLQKLPKLEKLGLITEIDEAQDGRKRSYALTARGAEQLGRFQNVRALIVGAYAELFTEVGDMYQQTSKTIAALNARTLNQRISKHRKD